MHTEGLKYRKVDLHIHTPASKCFLNTFSTNEEAAKAIVQKAIDENIEAIAITDHNTGEFIPFIQQAAKDRNITVFPGVELTVGDAKTHIIAILDKTKVKADIDDLLAKAEILNADRGKKDAFSKKSVDQIIDLVAGPCFNGIICLAHSDSTNGVLMEMEGQPRIKVVRNQKLFGAEVTNYSKTAPYLDGTDPNYQRKLAVYEASDNPAIKADGSRDTNSENSGKHTVDGIGYRYSYFKLDSNFNLDSLKQCFYDSDVRIKIPDHISTHVFPFVKSIKINSGFLKDASIELHQGLNSILGAKGVGKSLLIEFIRFALQQQSMNPEIQEDHESKLAERLGQYGQVEIDIADNNGATYTITRTFNVESGNPIECFEKSSCNIINGNISQLFPVLSLSQNEIIKIVENRNNELIQFIDKFFDFNSFINQINILENELQALDRDFAISVKAHYEKERVSKAIKTAEVELKRLEAQLNNTIFKDISNLEKLDKAFSKQLKQIEDLKEIISDALKQIRNQNALNFEDDISNLPAILRNNDILKNSKDSIEDTVNEILGNIAISRAQIDGEYKNWLPEYDKKKKELENYIRKVGGDTQSLELQRKKKSSEITNLKNRFEQLEKNANNLKSTSDKRNGKLNNLSEVYENYFRARKDKCDFFQDASNSKLQIQLEESTNRDEFKKRLMSIKSGSYLRDHEIDKLSKNVKPLDFVYSLLRYEIYCESDEAKAAEELKKLSMQADFTVDKMRKFCDYLISVLQSGEMEYETILKLQYKAQPTDRPVIEYNVGTKKSPKFKHISKVSTGQKCTALLILALSDGKMPIIIDQPEDSLDIRGIWEDMCQKIRCGKENRQFVFTTHNSSVAVASDTDKFTILTADDSHGDVLYSGSMDSKNVRSKVIEYLEGGIKPYILKMKKYNYNFKEEQFD